MVVFGRRSAAAVSVRAAEGITVSAVCSHLGIDIDDQRRASTLNKDDAAAVLAAIQSGANKVEPERLGKLGREAFGALPGYHCVSGEANVSGAQIPYIVETWADCRRVESRGGGDAAIELHVNRTPTISRLTAVKYTDGIRLSGCGLLRGLDAPAANYTIRISLITPYVQITTDGKEPDLVPFGTAIAHAVGKACRSAHRAMTKPVKEVSIKDAAWSVMEKAYLKASASGTLPANARQIMYAARPAILELTGNSMLNDAYFTQVLLPDYVKEYPEQTKNWNVVFDSRGTFIEPHTGKEVPVGTLEVAAYLGDRPYFGPVVDLADSSRFPTSGPKDRYSAILFIEKEGFDPLLRQAMIAERFDIAIMSTKGMSVTAARHLLDRLAPQIDKVLALHDFDVAGFSIFGTLGTDGRRYRFENQVPMHDLGLRLDDVKAMDLPAEPATTSGDWGARQRTLEEHGATTAEIGFLSARRVELNAMTSDQFIAFLERKLAEHGVAKVLPQAETLEQHARRVLEQKLAEQFISEHLDRLAREAAATALPTDLEGRVRDFILHHPDKSWDEALAHIVRYAA